MKLRVFTFFFALVTVMAATAADDVFGTMRGRWLDVAREATPQLQSTIHAPGALVAAVRDTAAFKYWRYDSIVKKLAQGYTPSTPPPQSWLIVQIFLFFLRILFVFWRKIPNFATIMSFDRR